MGDEHDSWPQAAQRWLGIVGLVVAPTTLVTGLAYFFGSISTGHRLSYFAVNSQAVGFTTADYLASTVGTLFFPIVRMLLIFVVLALAAALIHRLAGAGRYTPLIRWTAWGLMAVGVVALVRAVLGVIPGAWLPDDKIWLTPLSLSVGTLLLAAGYWMLAVTRKPLSPRPPAPIERVGLGLAVAIIVVGLFWSTDIYAANFGANAGAFTAEELWRRDDRGVILDTTDPLFLPDDMVKQSVLHADDSPTNITYRYQCLRVLEVHGDRWILVPAKWSQREGYAVMITPDARHRITTTWYAGLAERTGMAENVKPFWPCPEAVRVFTAEHLPSMLLDEARVQRILNTPTLISRPLPAMTGEPDQVSDPCARISVPVGGSYHDRGVTASLTRVMTADVGTGQIWIDQSVVAFQTPDAAANFMARAQVGWPSCGGHVVTAARGGPPEPRKLQGAGQQDNILVMDDTALAGPVNDCSHSIAAISNVVIDVAVCGAQKPLAAGSIVAAIRNNVPRR